MFEISFIYPGAVEDCYSFSLFPCIMIDSDSTQHTRSFMLMWLFWGVNIIRHFI